MPFTYKVVRSITFLLGLFITCSLFCGCASENDGDKQVFSFNLTEGLATLDPAFAKSQSTIWVAHQLYSTLVETDSNLNIVPSVAKSWEVDSDRLIYTFHLRSDVSFHDNA